MQLLGGSRLPHQVAQDDETVRLALYKTLATVRDTKQVFIYVSIFANQITINPLRVLNPNLIFENPIDTEVTLVDVAPYYAPLGTTRNFRIGEQINSLLDLTVPKDKYFIEINLAEAQIEADPSNFIRQPNLDISTISDPTNPNRRLVEQTYDLGYIRQADPTVFGPNIPRTEFETPIAREATKRSIPQPLFIRIPQLANGEPYNWTVVNTGQVNDDKNHQLVVRHGDINYQELQLEFGHLVFTGKDNYYQNYGQNQVTSVPAPRGPNQWIENNISGITDTAEQDISFYNHYKYLDYNYEWPNNEAVSETANMSNPQYVVPASRARSYVTNEEVLKEGAPPQTLRLAATPLKTNQQVSNITLRFLVRVISLF